MAVEESVRRPAAGPLRYLLMAGHVPAGGDGGGVVRDTLELSPALARRPDVHLHLGINTGAVDYFRETCYRTAAVALCPSYMDIVAPGESGVCRLPRPPAHGIRASSGEFDTPSTGDRL